MLITLGVVRISGYKALIKSGYSNWWVCYTMKKTILRKQGQALGCACTEVPWTIQNSFLINCNEGFWQTIKNKNKR